MNLTGNPQIFCDGRCAHCFVVCSSTGGCFTCSSSRTYCTCGALLRCGCGMSFNHPVEKCPNIVMPHTFNVEGLGWNPAVIIPMDNAPLLIPVDWTIPVKARFIKEIGTKAFLNAYWRGCDLTSGLYHRAEVQIAQSSVADDEMLGGEPESIPRERWPQTCLKCGAAVPSDAIANIYTRKVYDTDSGDPEPGDLFFKVECLNNEGKCYLWDNCAGPHLHGIVPTGNEWDLDSRASNCTMRENRSHRCWVRHGDPPNVTVDKNGVTCNAGAGSIATTSWHGFLRDGEWVQC